jgi:putative addiction module component (TIGR02574 family)
MKEFGIDRLSPEERIALALEIWESLGEARARAQLTAEQRSELARRDAELDANPGLALPWERPCPYRQGRECKVLTALAQRANS